MNTDWIYADTAKKVCDENHIKVFATIEAAEKWSEENDPRAWHLSTAFWSERWQRICSCHCNCRIGC